MKFFLTIVILLVIYIPQSKIQSQTNREHLREVEYLLSEGSFLKAQNILVNLMETNSQQNDKYDFYFAICSIKNNLLKGKALFYLKRIKDKEQFQEYGYYLGLVYQYLGEYELAIKEFMKIKETSAKVGGYGKLLVEELDLFITQCKNGIKYRDNNNQNFNTKILNLGPGVNSIFDEFSPVPYIDLKSLIFASNIPDTFDLEDIVEEQIQDQLKNYVFLAKYEREEWMYDLKDRRRILPRDTSIINTRTEEIPLSFNSKNIIYFLRDTALFYVDKNTDSIKKINYQINEKDFPYYVSMTISKNGKYIFVIFRDYPNATGGKDIFLSKKNSIGGWTPLEELKNINTPYDEDFPYLMEDNETFYFSSNGDKSMGGYDIFQSSYKDGIFADPVNIGYPINTPSNETSFAPATEDARIGYLSSDRIGSYGGWDLYRYFSCTSNDSVEIIGEIRMGDSLKKGNEMKYTDLYVNYLNKAKRKDTTISYKKSINFISNSKGTFRAKIPKKDSMQLMVTEPNYDTATFRLDFKNQCFPINDIKIVLYPRRDYKNNITEQKNVLNYTKLISSPNGITIDSYVEQTQEFSLGIENIDYLSYENYLAYLDSIKEEEFRQKLALAKSGENVNFKNYELEKLGLKPEETPENINFDSILLNVNKNEMIENGKVFYTVNFEFGKSEVKSIPNEILTQLKNIMLSDKNLMIKIIGHTDSKGSSEYNKKLSLRRSNAVKKYIQSMIMGVQIEESRYYIYGFGEDKLLEKDYVNGKYIPSKARKNRRSEIFIDKISK